MMSKHTLKSVVQVTGPTEEVQQCVPTGSRRYEAKLHIDPDSTPHFYKTWQYRIQYETRSSQFLPSRPGPSPLRSTSADRPSQDTLVWMTSMINMHKGTPSCHKALYPLMVFTANYGKSAPGHPWSSHVYRRYTHYWGHRGGTLERRLGLKAKKVKCKF